MPSLRQSGPGIRRQALLLGVIATSWRHSRKVPRSYSSYAHWFCWQAGWPFRLCLCRGRYSLRRAPELELLDRTGQPLRVARPGDGPFRRPLEYGEIPQPLIQATLAAEDRRFWRHPGVDWRATARAAWQWAIHRHVVSGGSTITQQLIKLAEPRPRNLRTKLIEAVQALRLEQVWDKQRILAAYLNRLDYGNFNRGCAAAADFYFAKPLRDLSPAECALLAALPQAPTRLNPHAHFERAVKRQQWVLGQMRQAGWLTEAQFQRATQEPLHLAAARRVFEAPHFVDLLLSVGSRKTGRRAWAHASTVRRPARSWSAPVLWRSRNRGCRSRSARGLAQSKTLAPPRGPVLRTTLDLALKPFRRNGLAPAPVPLEGTARFRWRDRGAR